MTASLTTEILILTSIMTQRLPGPTFLLSHAFAEKFQRRQVPPRVLPILLDCPHQLLKSKSILFNRKWSVNGRFGVWMKMAE